MSRWYLKLVILLLCAFTATGQTSDELKQKQQKLKEDIRYKEKLLEQIKEDSKSSSTKIVLLNKKLSQREELIFTIRDEIDFIEDRIAANEDLIEALEGDVENLKAEYAKMVVQAYKTRNVSNKVMFIFASEDFGQAFRRLKYLQQLSEYRKQQAIAIQLTQESLEKKRTALERQREEKNSVLNEQNKEKLTLSRERQEREKKLDRLLQDEAKYKQDLKQSERQAEELRNAIKKAIEREIAARNAATGSSGTSYKLTPEARELSNNFASNKGKLPWPVDKGEVTSYFGTQPHPFLNGIEVKNNGITISTTENMRSRAVFDGEVSKIMILPGAGKVVMIRHGEYISVYTNLKETFVSTGDKVKTKQEIGVLLTDKGKTETEFQIWKGVELLDPSYWIYKGR